MSFFLPPVRAAMCAAQCVAAHASNMQRTNELSAEFFYINALNPKDMTKRNKLRRRSACVGKFPIHSRAQAFLIEL